MDSFRTNSIEIFIDPDGLVTFSDLPEALWEVAQLLEGLKPSAEPDPQSPEWPDQQD